MNIEKLAKMAGVSVGTVSKAFSGSKEISEKTREKIFNAAKDCGCFFKYDKKGTTKKVVAIICHEIESEYYARAIAALNKKLSENGAIPIISFTDFSAEKQAELLAFYSSKNKDGLFSITDYEKICDNGKYSMLKILISTGRRNTRGFNEYPG